MSDLVAAIKAKIRLYEVDFDTNDDDALEAKLRTKIESADRLAIDDDGEVAVLA